MSILIGIDTIGSTLFNGNLPTSINNKFNNVQLKNCIVDELYISKDGDISISDKQDWIINTYLNAKFKGDLEAGNVGLGGLVITDWKVRRRKIDKIDFKQLDIVPNGTDENFYYLDTSPQSTIIYEYEVIPMAGDIEGTPITTQIKCEFDYWWISDKTHAYPLFLNLDVGDINTNTKRHVYEGFDQYPTIGYGNLKYKVGSITAIIANAFINMNKHYRDEFEDFLNNQKPKLLKNPKGDIWVVDTHTARRKPQEGFVEDLSTITFEWTEIDKIID